MRSPTPLLRIALAAAALAACAPVPRGPADPATVAALERLGARACVESTARGVGAAGVTAQGVDSVFYTEQVAEDGENNYVVGYLAWLRVLGRPGYLVVDLDEFCRVEQVYTRDGMRLGGIPAY
jgi:hypothetical protein